MSLFGFIFILIPFLLSIILNQKFEWLVCALSWVVVSIDLCRHCCVSGLMPSATSSGWLCHCYYAWDRMAV